MARLIDGKPAIPLGLPDPRHTGWGGKAPLWFSILREDDLNCDRDSYLHARVPFRPRAPIPPAGTFTMGEFVAFAGGA